MKLLNTISVGDIYPAMPKNKQGEKEGTLCLREITKERMKLHIDTYGEEIDAYLPQQTLNLITTVLGTRHLHTSHKTQTDLEYKEMFLIAAWCPAQTCWKWFEGHIAGPKW